MHLALVEEGQHQALGGLLDERRLGLHDVFEIDVRALAAQLDGGGGNDVLRRALEDVRADRGGTGEGDLGDALAGGQGLAGLPAEALDDVEHARRQQVADEFNSSTQMPSGVCSAGLSTTQLPAASAGASFQAAISSGKFHGMICPTTPSGSWMW